MKKIILNFENCQYISEIHKVLKTEFDLPDYYGENWDALLQVCISTKDFGRISPADF
ncbi:MAG: barstar family protein [Ruminococcus sp.]|nr:barstar family protein [Ruminococcus sp.]